LPGLARPDESIESGGASRERNTSANRVKESDWRDEASAVDDELADLLKGVKDDPVDTPVDIPVDPGSWQEGAGQGASSPDSDAAQESVKELRSEARSEAGASALERLRGVASQTAQEDAQQRSFRKRMSALRSLGASWSRFMFAPEPCPGRTCA